MKILVTGASGFIGSNLIKKLRNNSAYTIHALVRNQDGIPAMEKISITECDILDTDRIREATSDADVVIHLAAVKEHYKDKDVIFSANVQGTKNMLDCSRNVKQFIFTSSTLVSRPSDPYSESKKQCERLTIESGITYTILRLGPVFGSGDKTNLTKLIERIRSGKTIPIPGNGKQLIQPTHVDDVVRAIESSILNEDYFNRTCTVAGKPVTLEEFIDSIGRIVDKNAKRIHVPVGMLRPIVKVYQKMSDSPKITVEQLDNLGKTDSSNVVDSDFPTSLLDASIEKTIR